ncbi:MAG: prepilin-type N-terminal cleavage/methylation domain-containing protein [Rickettsiales bacterium]|nr:prepilin-type N-terminal cleavage/methylation domain-containing protein [Rickettsiales bacterium]
MTLRAFTLIEISIVLVIIGLIAGGVLVGQDLIKAASIRAQIKQIETHEAAFNTFRLKYNGLPGDLINPDQFFTNTLTGAATGNGNGIVEFQNNNFYDDGVLWDTGAGEVRRFFTQLSDANLTQGQFDGSRILGKAFPSTELSDTGGFFVASSASFRVGSNGRSPDNTINYRRGNNVMWFVACNAGAAGTTATTPNNASPFNNAMFYWDDFCAIFTPQELQNIDTKIDDGRPLSGRFFGFGGHDTKPVPTVNLCLSNPTSPNATYILTTTTKQCQAAYVLN